MEWKKSTVQDREKNFNAYEHYVSRHICISMSQIKSLLYSPLWLSVFFLKMYCMPHGRDRVCAVFKWFRNADFLFTIVMIIFWILFFNQYLINCNFHCYILSLYSYIVSYNIILSVWCFFFQNACDMFKNLHLQTIWIRNLLTVCFSIWAVMSKYLTWI